MPSPIPYLDTTGFTNRTVMPPGDVALVTGAAATFLPTLIADEQAYITERLRKRYPSPFGQTQPPLSSRGTTPPGVTVTGTPTVGSNELVVAVTTPGPLGTATFQWSTDGGQTWQATGVATASSVVLAGTGLTLLFPTGTYSTDNVYAAPTPVPRGILRRLAKLVTPAMYRKRGVDPADPQMTQIIAEEAEIRAELKEAADSESGLFDVPVSDAVQASAITEGTPLSYSESSPWEWADRQAGRGERYDRGR